MNYIKKSIQVLVLSLLITSCNFEGVNQSFYQDKLGLNIRIRDRVYSSHENKENYEMHFNVYDFEKIKKAENLIKDGYPKYLNKDKGWKIINWKKTNLFSEEKKLDIFRNYTYSITDLEDQIEKMKLALNQDDNYFTYLYTQDSNSNIIDLQLFVLDSKNSKFYIYELFGH